MASCRDGGGRRRLVVAHAVVVDAKQQQQRRRGGGSGAAAADWRAARFGDGGGNAAAATTTGGRGGVGTVRRPYIERADLLDVWMQTIGSTPLAMARGALRSTPEQAFRDALVLFEARAIARRIRTPPSLFEAPPRAMARRIRISPPLRDVTARSGVARPRLPSPPPPLDQHEPRGRPGKDTARVRILPASTGLFSFPSPKTASLTRHGRTRGLPLPSSRRGPPLPS